MKELKKILIANRGEIAVRIIKTAQSLGYETVAVFSDADQDAPQVSMADQSVHIGGPAVGESYLNGEKIIAAAQAVGADSIHPGYGFLSENPEFARQVAKAGLIWIGPPPEAMEIMGNKGAAKAHLMAVSPDVPMVPGYTGEDQSDAKMIAAADEIGYPIMVKAAAGGGGRGMRLVTTAEDLPAALASARSESLKAFGSEEILLEKGIVNPRHIEVQVFGDSHGNVIHLGERDCSIQRRHQKVVEEAPSPAVSPELREQIGKAAVNAARGVQYVGAGTVEFLLDETGSFYFIEMNTRLQVEHPVTELITGLDLVAWQILVAEGEPLPMTQADVSLSGHAIEVRLYAEDPDNQFLPSIGPVIHWTPPTGEGVRVDHGLRSGMEITPFYDAMVAKIIAYGETRAVARRRLARALKGTTLFGPTSNQQFLYEAVQHPVFAAGEATTQFIQTYWDAEDRSESVTDPAAEAARLAGLILYLNAAYGHAGGFPFWQCRSTTYQFAQADGLISIGAKNRTDYEIAADGELVEAVVIQFSEQEITVQINGIRSTAAYAIDDQGGCWVQIGAWAGRFEDQLLAPPAESDAVGSGKITAPMPGSVMRIDVAVGDPVSKGQTLLILEAMKMEHAITAPFDGVVESIEVEAGQQMQPRGLMLTIGGKDE